ncbi:MAG TPA: thioredoxin domain-containing protein [Actinobacteria bacterium]|nr:thioredoxin domain-containing protein [Actinomycetota bacterium]
MNRLAAASSPYLLQHADNPVDWFEWGDDAFAEARRRDVPIHLSVGYAACHWCHVMAHESFEDPDTAAYLNAHFVNVKVDREERPDVDRIYMDAVQALTGQGGWPLTVFLTPDGRPFYGGTYFPKVPHHGRPSFRQVLERITELWERERSAIVDQADRLTAAIRAATPPPSPLPSDGAFDEAVDRLAADFDDEHGGFGHAPKFPQPAALEYLLRYVVLGGDPDRRDLARRLLVRSLDAMARGGIHDHLGGGFARYAVDARWLVPHFEKMLYDNALLARTYLRGWQTTGVAGFVEVARRTLDYLDREMADPSGALHASEDADSEGVEGKYYVWRWDELDEVLGDLVDVAADLYGATPEGNFEGANVLHLPRPLPETARRLGIDVDELATVKAEIDRRLLERRRRRVRPGRDDKIVVAWNGLALRAFAEAAAVLDEPRYLRRARAIAEFLAGPALVDGALLRTWRRGRPGTPGYADDHAAAALGLFTLSSVDGDERWFEIAERLVADLVDRFADDAEGFFANATDALVARPKNVQDAPVPSDNALAAEALALHRALTGDLEASRHLEGALRLVAGPARAHPRFGGHALAVMLTLDRGLDEVAVVGPPEARRPLVDVVWERFRPTVVLAQGDVGGGIPLLRGRTPSTGPAEAFVCREMVCELPTSDPEGLRRRLDRREIPG